MHRERGDPLPNARQSAWLESSRAEKIPEVVARRILQIIVHRDMLPGDRLPPEAEMLSAFGVGRASLREALRILEMHGLLRIKPGPHGGPVVTEAAAADYGRSMTLHLQRRHATFRELAEARLVVEPMMTRLATERLNPEGASRLQAAARSGWDSVDSDLEWPAAAQDFHDVLAAMSGNRVLDIYAGALVRVVQRHLSHRFVDRSAREPTLHAHDRLLAAILAGDATEAERLSRAHLAALLGFWEAHYASQLEMPVVWE